jgi:hypothetical protein
MSNPQSAESFLGREDFYVVGDSGDIARRWSGVLFTELIFPVRGYVEGANDNSEAEAVRPEDVGLTVRSRDEVGLPECMAIGGSPYPSNRQRLHERTFGTTLSPRTAAIQVAGVLAVGQDHELVEAICSRPVQRVVPDFVAILEELIGTMPTDPSRGGAGQT